MSLANLALAVWVLLISGQEAGYLHFAHLGKLIAGVGVAFVVLLLLALSQLWSPVIPLKVKRG